jgi:hypothetical protein
MSANSIGQTEGGSQVASGVRLDLEVVGVMLPFLPTEVVPRWGRLG